MVASILKIGISGNVICDNMVSITKSGHIHSVIVPLILTKVIIQVTTITLPIFYYKMTVLH